jgi:hypothetical protein
VEVRDSAGELRAGVHVRFESSSAPLRGYTYPVVLLSAFPSEAFRPAAQAVTDATGRAVVHVQMGVVAAAGQVAITAPTLGLAGTAAFTVAPGAPRQISVAPTDTAVYRGASFALRITCSDRWGNPTTSDSPAITHSHPAVASLSGTLVGAQAIGRDSFTIAARGVTARAAVSVVPQGYLLAGGTGGIYGFELDGSGYRRIAAMNAARSPRWFPGGQTFAFGAGVGHGWISDMNGATRPLVQGANPLAGELWPHPSRDGHWVYFGGYDANGRGYPYRVRADGTGLQLVPGFTANDRTQGYPTTSPSGDRVAYFHEGGSSRDVTLRILNMQTGQLVVQGISGHTPEWSHGDSIAYLDTKTFSDGPIRLMSSAGAGHRQVGTGSYDFGIDWSPDDRWIVGRDARTARLEIVEVATGMRLPLGSYTLGLFEPAWKP